MGHVNSNVLQYFLPATCSSPRLSWSVAVAKVASGVRAMLGIAAAGCLLFLLTNSGSYKMYVGVMLLMACCGIAVMVACGFRAILDPPSRPLFLAMIAISLYAVLTIEMLLLSARLNPTTFDNYLYLFDGSLGLQPAFAWAQIMDAHRWLRVPGQIVYANLPLGMAAVYF